MNTQTVSKKNISNLIMEGVRRGRQIWLFCKKRILTLIDKEDVHLNSKNFARENVHNLDLELQLMST